MEYNDRTELAAKNAAPRSPFQRNIIDFPQLKGGYSHHSATSIGAYAFDGCESLSSIVIGDNVGSIGNVFRGCHALSSVVIGDSVTSIDAMSASLDCGALTSAVIGNAVTASGPLWPSAVL